MYAQVVGRLKFVVNIGGSAGGDTYGVARRKFTINKEISLAVEIIAVVGNVVDYFLPLSKESVLTLR